MDLFLAPFSVSKENRTTGTTVKSKTMGVHDFRMNEKTLLFGYIHRIYHPVDIFRIDTTKSRPANLRKLDLYGNGDAHPAARTEPRKGRSTSMPARNKDQELVRPRRHGHPLLDHFRLLQEQLDETAGFRGLPELVRQNQFREFIVRHPCHLP